ncbi:MAG: hypothetical protein FWG14_12335 [Peptococcaceae bacterium]|nr:hypothetical protein [Peptococcaceae bacterium]
MYQLDKSVWTQDDYEQMGWHDCVVHGIGFASGNEQYPYDLLFDIDYIFNWVHPVPPEKHFSFWISPCTLIFKDIYSLHMQIESDALDFLEIDVIKMVNKTEQNGVWVYEWEIWLQEGCISFKSSGFRQIIRFKPVFSKTLSLTIEDRRGINFELTPCEL